MPVPEILQTPLEFWFEFLSKDAIFPFSLEFVVFFILKKVFYATYVVIVLPFLVITGVCVCVCVCVCVFVCVCDRRSASLCDW